MCIVFTTADDDAAYQCCCCCCFCCCLTMVPCQNRDRQMTKPRMTKLAHYMNL